MNPIRRRHSIYGKKVDPVRVQEIMSRKKEHREKVQRRIRDQVLHKETRNLLDLIRPFLQGATKIKISDRETRAIVDVVLRCLIHFTSERGAYIDNLGRVTTTKPNRAPGRLDMRRVSISILNTPTEYEKFLAGGALKGYPAIIPAKFRPRKKIVDTQGKEVLDFTNYLLKRKTRKKTKQ